MWSVIWNLLEVMYQFEFQNPISNGKSPFRIWNPNFKFQTQKLLHRRFNQNVDYDLEFLTQKLLLKNEFIKIGV